MKTIGRYLLSRLITGLLIIVPLYLCVLLLLKAMASVGALVKPITLLFPPWFPGEALMALLLLAALALAVGIVVQTALGRAIKEWIERSLFERMPGYSLFRSLTHRLAGKGVDQAWKPALAEIEDALVPAFIIEELKDGRYTVFVPSVPTPLAGAVYVLESRRVHPLEVPFSQAIKVVSRWGEGAKELVSAMERSGGQES